MPHVKPLGENKKVSRYKNISEISAEHYKQYLLTEGNHVAIPEIFSKKSQLTTCYILTTSQDVTAFNLVLAIYL